MMLVTAMVEPFALRDVRAGLEELDVPGVTVAEVSASGGGRAEARWVDLVPEVRVEVVVEDGAVERVLAAVAAASRRTGGTGGGTAWVTPVEAVVRVRTGERGADAL